MKNTRFLQLHRRPRMLPVRPAHVALCALAIALAIFAPSSLVEGVMSAGRPLLSLRSAIAQTVVQTKDRVVMSRRDVEAENARLREENARLRIKGALYDELKNEAQRLEALAGRAPAQTRSVLARVLASPAASPYDSVLIDVGAKDDVAAGDRVLFDGTIVLGTIDFVAEATARVRLFSSPGLSHEVYIGTTTTRFEAEGKGGGMFVAKVPSDVAVRRNDAFMHAGTREAIALVTAVEAKPSEAFQTVYATLPVNLFETREVIVERRVP